MLTPGRGAARPSLRTRLIVAVVAVALSAADWLAYATLRHGSGVPVAAILMTLLAALFIVRAFEARL